MIITSNSRYNIQAYTEHRIQEAQRIREREEARLREERNKARRSSPAYRKKVLIAILLAVIGIVVCIASVVVVTKIKENKSYEKDLSSVFKITFDASIDDVIKFEADELGNTDYYQDYSLDGETLFINFEPFVDEDGITRYQHAYGFDANKKLTSIVYGMFGRKRSDKHDYFCKHIQVVKNRALLVSPFWDKSEDDGKILRMNGQINGVKCRVTCFYDFMVSLRIAD